MLEERQPFLKTYNVLLTTKSPVHIGSGDSYFPFLYIKQSDNKLMVFDEEEVLTKLSELGKSEEFNKIIKSNKGDKIKCMMIYVYFMKTKLQVSRYHVNQMF